MKKMKKITKDTTVEEVLQVPGAEEILAKYSFPCLSCPMAAIEISKLKIGETARMYGINERALVEEINKKLEGK